MSNYQRTTRQCPFDQLRPDLQQAFRDYFTARESELPETESLLCCETTSIRDNSGWFANLFEKGEETTSYTAILLTPQSLLWARAGEHSTAQAIGATLYGIRVKKFTALLTRDSGLEISGIIENAKGFMRGYIGLGPEPAAQDFCEKVEQAIEAINPRPTRKFPQWMGGR